MARGCELQSSCYSRLRNSSYADALLVPRPNHPENYYFVSVQASAASPLLYSIIDTRLNGGQGDFVVGGSRLDSLNQVLHPQAIQGLMLARHANRHDLWVLSATATGFRCYRVTPAGIQRAGISSPFRGGTLSGAASLKLTSRGTELLVTRTVVGLSIPAAYTEVYRFDPATGQVAQGRLVRRQRHATLAINYLTPSPNGRYVYEQVDSVRGTSISSQIVQYDLSAADSLAFRRSRRLVYWSDTLSTNIAFNVFAPFRAGPDGRLYILNANAGLVDSLSVIERPDAPAAQCRFRRSALPLINSIPGGNGIDPLEHIPSGFNFLAGFRAIPACQGSPVSLTLDNAAYLDSARWRFGDGAGTTGLGPLQHLYAQPGTYRVQVQVFYGGYSTDTLSQVVTIFPAPTVRLPADTASCGGQAVLTPRGLSASMLRYQWNTGATTPTLRVTQAGTYSLTVTNARGCTAIALVRFTASPTPTVLLPTDTTSCGGTLASVKSLVQKLSESFQNVAITR
jgi:hypothetical protein